MSLTMSLSRNLTSAVSNVSSWQRPSDWLTLPSLGASEQKVVGLIAIFEDSNFLSLFAIGAYTVDWGDGVIENYANNVQSYHTYNYANISNSTLCSRGYKQVLVTITPQAGQNLTSFNLGRKHNQARLSFPSTPWLDITINGPNITSMTLRSTLAEAGMLEKVTLGILGNITSFNSLFQFAKLLQSVSIADSDSVTDFSNMFYDCTSLESVPLFDTSAGTNFSSMFQYCSALKSVPMFNTSKSTSFSSMFAGCTALQSIPLLDTSSGTSFNNMFNNCPFLQSIPLLNTSSGTSFTSMFAGCVSLAKATLSGTTRSISYSTCKLSRSAIVDIFNNLGTASGTQTINVSNNWGSALLTAGDIAIATSKGWTVTT